MALTNLPRSTPSAEFSRGSDDSRFRYQGTARPSRPPPAVVLWMRFAAAVCPIQPAWRRGRRQRKQGRIPLCTRHHRAVQLALAPVAETEEARPKVLRAQRAREALRTILQFGSVRSPLLAPPFLPPASSLPASTRPHSADPAPQCSHKSAGASNG